MLCSLLMDYWGKHQQTTKSTLGYDLIILYKQWHTPLCTDCCKQNSSPEINVSLSVQILKQKFVNHDQWPPDADIRFARLSNHSVQS